VQEEVKLLERIFMGIIECLSPLLSLEDGKMLFKGKCVSSAASLVVPFALLLSFEA
jgi:hypothetical protein